MWGGAFLFIRRPIFLTMLYVIHRAVNRVPELRRRIEDGQVVEYDECPVSFTEMKPDGSYAYCRMESARVPYEDYIAMGMVAWAKENARVSGLEEAPIRWIVDDCAKFVEREIRRGKTYDAIIMDPPSYGRGPGGEVWKLEENLYPFVKLCARVLSDKPLFVILNSYTTGLAPSVLGYILQMLVGRRFGGHVTWDELGLPCTDSGMALPCGATGRWMSK